MNRICHITTVHNNRYDIRIFEKECVSLSQAGFDVYLIVNDDKPDETKDGVKLISLNEHTKNRIDRAIRVSRVALKKALEIDADIYHIHDPELLQIIPHLKKRNKKVVFDSHEFTAKQIENKKYLPKLLRRPIGFCYKQFEKHMIKKCDCVITPCTYEGKDYFSAINVPKLIISNYPSMKNLDELSEQGNDGLQHDSYKECLCYVGAISESRGIYQMVKAAYMSGRKLVLVGALAENIKETLENMPEYACVKYHGALQHKDAMRILGKCAIGLSLLLDEGQYMKIDTLTTKNYEYMYMGIPSILSTSPYSEKVIKKFKFGMAVDPKKNTDVVDAINTIMGDAELYRKMAEEGKRAIREEFNWESEAQKLIRMYRKLGE